MNEQLLASAYHELCETLLAIRKSREWGRTHSSFDEYVKHRWSLSKSRAALFCKFAKLLALCRAESMTPPETPDSVAPLLSLAEKDWIDVWPMILQHSRGPITAKHCQSVMDRFGIVSRRRIPKHVLDGQRLRRASKTLAELEDGERVADTVGPNGFGRDWDKAVSVVIDADQRRLDRQ